MFGPGVYDDLCTYVREQSGADAVIVLVINGKRGSGFSAQARPLSLPPSELAAILRKAADIMDEQPES